MPTVPPKGIKAIIPIVKLKPKVLSAIKSGNQGTSHAGGINQLPNEEILKAETWV